MKRIKTETLNTIETRSLYAIGGQLYHASWLIADVVKLRTTAEPHQQAFVLCDTCYKQSNMANVAGKLRQ